jgi:hypothetical protein
LGGVFGRSSRVGLFIIFVFGVCEESFGVAVAGVNVGAGSDWFCDGSFIDLDVAAEMVFCWVVGGVGDCFGAGVDGGVED